LLNYNFNPFFFFKDNDYIIRLRVVLTFSKVITNFLNSLNIYIKFLINQELLGRKDSYFEGNYPPELRKRGEN